MSANKRTSTSTGEFSIQKPSVLLIEAVNEDSNREIDWLWYADNVENDTERSYCLNRALYINPDNHHTRLALYDLLRRRQYSYTESHESSFLVWFGRLFGFANA